MILKPKKLKEEDPFVRDILNNSVEAESFSETTHIHVKNFFNGFFEGMYEYHGNGSLTQNEEFKGMFPKLKEATSLMEKGYFTRLKHQPTYDRLVELGLIVEKKNGAMEIALQNFNNI